MIGNQTSAKASVINTSFRLQSSVRGATISPRHGLLFLELVRLRRALPSLNTRTFGLTGTKKYIIKNLEKTKRLLTAIFAAEEVSSLCY